MLWHSHAQMPCRPGAHVWAHAHAHPGTQTHSAACRALGPAVRDLAQLLVDAEVVHHDGAIQDFQQGVLCEGLLRLLGGPPQQQALVPVAALN